MNTEKEKEAFRTHYNYADCLTDLINNSSLKYNLKLNFKKLPYLKEKQNLITLTKKSLEDEYKIVQMDKEYSYASTSWLPIKSYYLIFNQLLTVEYIIKIQKKVFNSKHSTCIREFTRKLEKKEIEFNEPILNEVYDKTIFSYHDVPGANLSRRISKERRYKLAMAKASDYKLNEWKRGQSIESFKTKKNREKKKEYLKSFKFSIFEFPYYMRIRSNYRDFAFIEGVSIGETASYFECYYLFTMGFYKRLNDLQKSLMKMRGYN